MSEFIEVRFSAKDQAEAEKIVYALLEKRLIACAQIIPTIHSLYLWKGVLTKDTECLVLLKTPTSCYRAIETTIAALHSYEVPEILAVPIEKGLPSYLEWVATTCANGKEP